MPGWPRYVYKAVDLERLVSVKICVMWNFVIVFIFLKRTR